MIELSPELACIIMLGGVVFGVFLGFPLAIPVGAIGLILGYLMYGDMIFSLFYMRTYQIISSYVLLAAPLFIFMGIMLERSGIGERMYAAMYLWLSGLRGGLAVVTVLVGTILAACIGIVGASVTMLSIVALPAMVKRGYSKSLATGAVAAGGTLGTLIPPSILLIIYGPMANISVGKLFFAAFLPGFLISGLYCTYIVVRCLIDPNAGPAVPAEERRVPLAKKITTLATSLLPPGILILAVLGVIFFGIAPPTEAAAVGAFAAILLALAHRSLNFKVLKDVTLQTLKVSAMVYLIAGLAFAFVGTFLMAGAGGVVENLVLATPGGRWGAFAVIMFIIFILGFLIDILGIIFIMIPIIAPIVPAMGFDPLWFALMVIINFQMAYMTPPMAFTIFYIKGAAPPELGVTTAHIIRGIIPFVFLIMVGMLLCVAFPQIITWLPSQMITGW